MKLTKYCLLPWTFMQIHAGGMMQCCAVAPDGDIGDFILDYCDKVDNDPDCDPFNNEGLQKIREGILTGNLRPMCRNCFFITNNLITTDELKHRLKDVLNKYNPGPDYDKADLTKVHAYTWMAISFTNRCNLSCIYCVQSVHKETNPYFKMDFPYERAKQTLDFLASQGAIRFSTCVEGEATLYKHWCELFTWFHDKYPAIKLRMTTNLNRKYNDEEIELLTNYTILDVSIDSLDPKLYSEMRVNGKIELVLDNLDKISQRVKEKGVKGPHITLHTVVSDKTWTSLEALSNYAFERGYGVELGNYEIRANTLAYKQNLIKPIMDMPKEEREAAYEVISRIKAKGESLGLVVGLQGDIFKSLKADVEANYNIFTPYNNNPVFKQFYEQYNKGLQDQYLDIIYDCDNISHEGIIMGRGEKLVLNNMDNVEYVVVREIHIYKAGTVSTRYDQNVMLRYRKKITPVDGCIELEANYPNDNVERVLIEVTDYKFK